MNRDEAMTYLRASAYNVVTRVVGHPLEPFVRRYNLSATGGLMYRDPVSSAWLPCRLAAPPTGCDYTAVDTSQSAPGRVVGPHVMTADDALASKDPPKEVPSPIAPAAALTALALVEEWVSSGRRYRHHPSPRSPCAFQVVRDGEWVDSSDPGHRPWKRSIATPAPCTLNDCVEFTAGLKSVHYKRASWPDDHGEPFAWMRLMHAADAIADDWLYSTDGGVTWKSPGAPVEKLERIE